ncbi:MAG: hypothetical protein AM1032_000377 [Mycoplasmataceae bacterium]|nr:MAG: hypothetical protein AM1032_000377 [Mycoplasmataceae bacterium]
MDYIKTIDFLYIVHNVSLPYFLFTTLQYSLENIKDKNKIAQCLGWFYLSAIFIISLAKIWEFKKFIERRIKNKNNGIFVN